MHFRIFGAGSIGCYVGGMLAANGEEVTLYGRPAMASRLLTGLRLTRHDGLTRDVAPEAITFSTEAEALGACDIVLVCVKSGDTDEAGRVLADVAARDAIIVSLQNGVSNADKLGDLLPGHTVLAAMVPFNVTRIGDNRFHCGTQGDIVIERTGRAGEIARKLSAAGVATVASDDITGVLWAKLLLNLNNAVNVLSGLPLKAQLSKRAYRRVLEASMSEGLTVLAQTSIKPARIEGRRVGIIPWVLLLPDWLFAIVAARMLKIDETARSSMADDLEAGREPEIDYINGEIVRLGWHAGPYTPVNEKLIDLVKAAFAAGRSPEMTGEELLSAVGLPSKKG